MFKKKISTVRKLIESSEPSDDVFEKLFEKIDPDGTIFNSEEKAEYIAKLMDKVKEEAEKLIEEEPVETDEKEPVETEPIEGEEGEEITLEEAKKKLKKEKQECLAEAKRMLVEAEEKHQAEVEALDDEASASIEQVADEIDQAACDKIVELIDALDAEACEEIEKIKAAYEAKIAELDDEASAAIEKVATEVGEKAITESLVDKISTFLDMEIEKVIPTRNEVDSIKLSRLEKMYESVRELLFVNDDYVQKEIVEAVEDAAKIMKEKDSKINTVLNESLQYRRQLEKRESQVILESRTKHLPPKMRAFVESYCKTAPESKLEGKITEAIEAWNLDEKQTRKNARIQSTLQPITEEVVRKEAGSQTGDVINEYAAVLKKYAEL